MEKHKLPAVQSKEIILDRGAILGIAVVFIILPLFLSVYSNAILTDILILAIYAMSFDLLLGYLGLLSFGHSAFWGTGAYVVGILLKKGLASNFLLILFSSMGVGLIQGIFFGLIVMRTSQIYFTFVTLALSQGLLQLSIKWESLTNGLDGISGIDLPYGINGTEFYYLVFIIYIICFLLIRWFTSARYGRILIGIRENEFRMKALGYNIWIYKYTCYILSGVFAAIAGSIAAYHQGIVSIEDYSFLLTGNAILMVLIGGKESQWGSLSGAVFVTLLTRIISSYTKHWLLIVGIVFVLVVLFAREGFMGLLSQLRKRGFNEGSFNQ